MSRHQENENVELPPVTEEVKNFDEMILGEIEGYRVLEWHPERDGQGEPTAVVLMFDVVGIPDIHFGMRLKSRRAVNELVTALRRHRDSVWPINREG